MSAHAPTTAAASSCSCRAATAPPQWSVSARRQQRNLQLCRADASVLQDLIVGSAVTAAGAAALLNGRKEDPQVCSSCAGTGGVKCFACEGSGKMLGVSREALAAAARQRDPAGGSRSKRECVACKGAGLIFCRQCKGSGYEKSI